MMELRYKYGENVMHSKHERISLRYVAGDSLWEVATLEMYDCSNECSNKVGDITVAVPLTHDIELPNLLSENRVKIKQLLCPSGKTDKDGLWEIEVGFPIVRIDGVTRESHNDCSLVKMLSGRANNIMTVGVMSDDGSDKIFMEELSDEGYEILHDMTGENEELTTYSAGIFKNWRMQPTGIFEHNEPIRLTYFAGNTEIVAPEARANILTEPDQLANALSYVLARLCPIDDTGDLFGAIYDKRIADTITFGKSKLPTVFDSRDVLNLAKYDRYCSVSDEAPWSKICDIVLEEDLNVISQYYDYLSKVDAACKIWKWGLRRRGLVMPTLDDMMEDDYPLDNLLQTGEELGIKTIYMAYLDGCPIEDLLA